MNEPKTVVVLFTDLVRSTEVVTANGVADLVGAHLDRQIAAVEGAGGEVVKTGGDGIMATFGSATAAASAAQVLQQRTDSAPSTGPIGGRVLRVGISAGDAVERDGDWFGVAVVEAARLCASAQGGQILAAQVVWLLTPPDVRARWAPLCKRSLKGLPDPIEVYEVPWARAEVRPVGVVVADDSALVRSGIARVLTDHGVRVLGDAADADELLALVGAFNPDVVIVDIRMPPTFTLEGIRAAELIRTSHPEVGILVLSQHVESGAALKLLQHHERGIGYLLKDRVADIDEFVEAVIDIAHGGTAIDPEIVQLLIDRPRERDALGLTARERDVLGLMAQGRSNRAIGERLGLTPRTVESHIASIFTKLGLEPEDTDHRRVLAVLTFLKKS